MSEATGGQAPERPPERPPGETRAIVALVCGVLSILAAVLFPIALALGIVGIVMGRSVRRAHSTGTTYGLATAGFVTGIIGTALAGMVLLVVVALVPIRGGMSADSPVPWPDEEFETEIELEYDEIEE